MLESEYEWRKGRNVGLREKNGINDVPTLDRGIGDLLVESTSMGN